jgi:D-serine deaminase-like pyridoxal phosphate-dependent protein
MQAAMKQYGIASRPHAKTHKCAAIAKRQLATGSIGICCAKLGEAEALAAQGVDKILMTTATVSRSRIRRAMALKKAHPSFIQSMDYAPNAQARSPKQPEDIVQLPNLFQSRETTPWESP